MKFKWWSNAFWKVALPRMKEVLAGKGNHEPYGISKEVKWQGVDLPK